MGRAVERVDAAREPPGAGRRHAAERPPAVAGEGHAHAARQLSARGPAGADGRSVRALHERDAHRPSDERRRLSRGRRSAALAPPAVADRRHDPHEAPLRGGHAAREHRSSVRARRRDQPDPLAVERSARRAARQGVRPRAGRRPVDRPRPRAGRPRRRRDRCVRRDGRHDRRIDRAAHAQRQPRGGDDRVRAADADPPARPRSRGSSRSCSTCSRTSRPMAPSRWPR